MNKLNSSEIILFDTEYTTWEGAQERSWSGPGEEMEVVQIGAVRIALDCDLTEVDTFEVLIKPFFNPKLSDYFINLTGISQEQLNEHGIEFSDAIEQFADFLGHGRYRAYSFGLAKTHLTDSWVLKNNCKIRDVEWPLESCRFSNISSFVMMAMGDLGHKVKYTSDLASACGIDMGGQAHQALGDARNIAETLRYLISEERIFVADLRNYVSDHIDA